MSDICDKLNFTKNYTYWITNDSGFIKKYITITIVDTYMEIPFRVL